MWADITASIVSCVRQNAMKYFVKRKTGYGICFLYDLRGFTKYFVKRKIRTAYLLFRISCENRDTG